MHWNECMYNPRGWKLDRPSIRSWSITDTVVNNTPTCICAWKANNMTEDSGRV